MHTIFQPSCTQEGFYFFYTMYMNKTIIVKVGTESLGNFHTSHKVARMVQDIARLIKEKVWVVLVSSGAVGCGREMLP